MKWTDTTNYRRGAERIPTTWAARAGRLRITVTTGHIHHLGRWVMHCSPFLYALELVGVETKEEAQAMAVMLVKEIIDGIVKGLEET